MSKPEVERQKSPNLGFWGRIGLESLWIFCKFFSILPYWFRYYVVEPAVFGALRLLRYRYRVVTENLRNSFPEKSLEELHAIRRGFYRTLAEIFVDTFTNGQVQIGAGDFTFFVKSGYLIEDGKLTQPIKDINIIGNGPKALADITMVADNDKIDNGTWTCGKDGQSCPVTCGMPSALVSKLTVGGES